MSQLRRRVTWALTYLVTASAVHAQPGAPTRHTAPDPPPPPAQGPTPAAQARPDPPPSSSTLHTQVDPPPPSPTRRALGLGAAWIPGVLVHGSGHYVIGQPTTAAQLLLAEVAGLGMILGGGSVIVLTGASRRLVGPAAAVTVLGFGVFATSLLADSYGVLLAGHDRGRALRAPPLLETSLGYRYVYDPQFDYRNFLVQSLDLHVGRLHLLPSVWSSLDHPNQRYRLSAGVRVLGRAAGAPGRAADGSYLEPKLAVTVHRFPRDGFELRTAELAIEGRYDLARMSHNLRGAFVDGELGYARQSVLYDFPGVTAASDQESLLLARWAFGAYIGGRRAPGSEVRLYYDHRHDDYAAGLKMTGLGSGVAGHFGVDGRWYLDESWGVLGEAQVGSAYVIGLSVLFRHGVMP